MSNRTHQVNQYAYSGDDCLLFDTNIWLFLYGPQYSPDNPRVIAYSEAAKRILAAKCHLFIDVLVLSEFVNAWARFEYNRLPGHLRARDFKAFRKSDAFTPVARDTATACRKIIGLCTPVNNGFETLNIAALLSDYETGKLDLNDRVLASLCEDRQFKLVTDDADFYNQNVTILTANQRLLNR